MCVISNGLENIVQCLNIFQKFRIEPLNKSCYHKEPNREAKPFLDVTNFDVTTLIAKFFCYINNRTEFLWFCVTFNVVNFTGVVKEVVDPTLRLTGMHSNRLVIAERKYPIL